VVFRWNEWNIGHLADHGVAPAVAEYVVRRARRPYPLVRGDGKWLVWGADPGGRLVQVVFVLDPDDAIFIIHARPLTAGEKRRFRRRSRS
jgi:uncharacterized DUF497 family protein